MRHPVDALVVRFARALPLALLLWLAGCAAQLAPAYDRAVTEGLSSTNIEVMTLLAAASDGTRPESFPSRQHRYDSVIGRLDALAIHAAARPVPSQRVTQQINTVLARRGVQALAGDDGTPPSAHAIHAIATTIQKMRDTDRKQGLTPTEVRAFKGQIAIYYDQAVTYENFLQR